MSDWTAITDALRPYAPITLEEMKAVRLMNRIDQKYIMPRKLLPALLESIDGSYYVQQIDGNPIADYHTLYFDTPTLAMYTQHHDQKLTRQKVRIRTYLSTQKLTTYFEIKNKNNKKKTKKIRIEVARAIFNDALADKAVKAFLEENTPYTPDELTEQLENNFGRITLVDKGFHERVTLDSDILFLNRATQRRCELSELAILEVKHQVGTPVSPIERALLTMRVHPRRISKYCIGTVLTNPACKYNRFKDKVRTIDKLTDGQCRRQLEESALFC
ncbi:MAG: VTC domain-containing protein [Bacteroidales bacterium]|nr:VTC domain-containing protein [Bacteroidales bacterium]